MRDAQAQCKQTTQLPRPSVRIGRRSRNRRPMESLHVIAMVLEALLIIQSYRCSFLYESVCNCIYISMSYYYSKYEFLGPDSARVRVWCG